MSKVLLSICYFLLAGLMEIGGGYLVWLWLRERRSIWLAFLGAAVLVGYGVVPTLQPHTSVACTPLTAACSWRCRSCGAGASMGIARTAGTWPAPCSASPGSD